MKIFTVFAVILSVLILAGCGDSHGGRLKDNTNVNNYKGHPIICIERGTPGRHTYAFSCDFVEWHHKYGY